MLLVFVTLLDTDDVALNDTDIEKLTLDVTLLDTDEDAVSEADTNGTA